MKIAIDAINLRGGGITHLQNILKHHNFLKKKTKLVIWCNKEVKKNIRKNKNIIIKNYKFFDGNIVLRVLWSFFFFSKDLKKSDCSVILCLNGIMIKNFKNNVVFFQNVLPLEINNLDRVSFLKKIKYYLQYIFFKNSYKNSKSNIFPSTYSKKLFEKKFGKRKNNFVVYHGVFKNKIPNKLNNNNILCISSLEIFKNIKNLIYAAEILQTKNINFNLNIIGPCSFRQKLALEKLILKKKLSKKIKHYNQMNETNIRKNLLNSKVLVNPSNFESFGLPNLEAFVFGLKLACSNIPVFREILNNYPFYFNQRSPKSIAKQLDKALKTKIKFSKKNISQVQKKFDWKKTSKRTFEIVDRIIMI